MKHNAYKEAGVDVDKAAKLIERIKPHTSRTKRSGVMSGIGGFGALFDLKETGYKDPIIVSATDGVGTKIKIAIELDRHDTIGIDCVAMCVNDLVVQGAEPLFFLDYFATGKLCNDTAEAVIAGVAEGCHQAGSALIGGETAEMPGLYMANDYDLAGFSVGAVERDQIVTGENIKPGDVILGLASNGVHSNGFSLVRHLIQTAPNFTFESPSPFDPALTLGELLLMPTRIYVKSVLKALKVKTTGEKQAIKGMVHITGGGFDENIPRILPDNCKADIDTNSWELPPLFQWLRDIGSLRPSDLSTTFNCGIGYMVVCDKDQAENLIENFKSSGESVVQIGTISAKSNDEPSVIMHDMDKNWSA
ncbi:MAG: phosphoribosylformylglycinamidine cyclo-ligase [Micavibrio sp.]|nr:phosphoribosylformylglycinamidine cyclo-ligase [Micavibrio sp.]|tara:strand:+ start:777 stop:1862 length:1086 start_codon:yes stop_codon:yes gene_type:complete